MGLFCHSHHSSSFFSSLVVLLLVKGKLKLSDSSILILGNRLFSPILSNCIKIWSRISSIWLLCFCCFFNLLSLCFTEVSGATFRFVNKCDFTVWPGILASAGSPKLETTGFELEQDSSRSLQAPTGWSGRFWGRTSCNFDSSGRGSCNTGDCGSGEIECNGAGATPPATLAEFTLGSGSQDFYDVSLVDGYNLPMIVEGTGGSGTCASTGCITDLNQLCPTELKADGGGACKSACEAFAAPEYCCSGAYNSPATCRPSMYSQMFKSACPKSYSYAYDDATSTFTCNGADYTITFCPSTPRSKKEPSDLNFYIAPNSFFIVSIVQSPIKIMGTEVYF